MQAYIATGTLRRNISRTFSDIDNDTRKDLNCGSLCGGQLTR